MATFALAEKAILLNPADDVMIAKVGIPAGTIIEDGPERVEVRQDIRAGHKVARHPARAGEPVRRYGQIIGFATQEIRVGDHVHVHNLAVGELRQQYEIGVDVKPVDYYPPERMRSFEGYKRADGRVGTRNYVAVLSTVNCSASVCQFVREKFRDVSTYYPNVDGVIAITHKSGCGQVLNSEDHWALQRVLAGYSKHPNVAAYVLIGLGCEVNQATVLVDKQKMTVTGRPDRPTVITIQESGGVRKTVEAAVAAGARLLPQANDVRRTRQPLSELVLATNCGGPGGNSGITANPAPGWARPGHDLVSITGLVAGGANIICFTTGRGSVFGCKPVPSIKLATNSLMYRHMEDDMDINCGVILEGTPLEAVGRQIFEEVVAVASSKKSKSELSGVGEEEFAPWMIGPVM